MDGDADLRFSDDRPNLWYLRETYVILFVLHRFGIADLRELHITAVPNELLDDVMRVGMYSQRCVPVLQFHRFCLMLVALDAFGDRVLRRLLLGRFELLQEVCQVTLIFLILPSPLLHLLQLGKVHVFQRVLPDSQAAHDGRIAQQLVDAGQFVQRDVIL